MGRGQQKKEEEEIEQEEREVRDDLLLVGFLWKKLLISYVFRS